jgi:PIN domain nuclease of toxin-antitoxin system
LIWFLEGDAQLSSTARARIENPSNINFVSIATFWEIAIKVSIGKLEMETPFSVLSKLVWQNGFEVLPIKFEHTLVVSSLPFHHKDPFDRILIAQAMIEAMPLISKDEYFDAYEVTKVW